MMVFLGVIVGLFVGIFVGIYLSATKIDDLMLRKAMELSRKLRSRDKKAVIISYDLDLLSNDLLKCFIRIGAILEEIDGKGNKSEGEAFAPED